MNIYAFKLAIIQREKMSLTETNIAREQAERWRSSPLLRSRTCGLFMHIAVGLRLGGGAVSDGVLGPPGQLPHDQGSHNKKPILPPICPLTTTPEGTESLCGARTQARHPLPPAAMALGLAPIPGCQARGLPTSPTEVVSSSHRHGPPLTTSTWEQATVPPDCFRHLPAELGSLACLVLKPYP